MNKERSGLEAIREKMQASLRATSGMATGEEVQKESPPAQKVELPADMQEITKPRKTSDKEVIFRSARLVFNFMYKKKQVSFVHGWLKTDDPELISYIEKNFPQIKKVD